MQYKYKLVSNKLDRHKTTLFLSIDGNFRLQLKIKNRTLRDDELFSAFFVPSQVFNEYQKGLVDDLDVSFRTQ